MAAQGQGGSIINIASILGLAGAEPAGRLLRLQGRPDQPDQGPGDRAGAPLDRVNAIAPGYIETDINRDFLASPEPGDRRCASAFRSAASASRRISTAPALLASDASRYMTGSVIVIDGGLTPQESCLSDSHGFWTYPPALDALRLRYRDFVAEQVLPIEDDPASYDEHENIVASTVWSRLRARAKDRRPLGAADAAWRGGLGLSVLEMAACYEEMGRSIFGPGGLQLRGARRRQHDPAGEGRHGRPRRSAWLQPIVDGRCAPPS